MTPPRYKIKKIRGREHKLCRGPLHSEGGEWVRVDYFALAKTKPRADGSIPLKGQCKACEAAQRNNSKNPRLISGYVPLDHYKAFIYELECRIGSHEAARRIGKTTWYKWKSGNRRYAQIASIERLMEVLLEARNKNEIRHKKSIRRGSAMRGEPEKIPVKQHEFYHPTGDYDLEARRKWRHEHLEHERERERTYRARKRAMSV